MTRNVKQDALIRTVVQECMIKTTPDMAWNGLPHGNGHGFPLRVGGDQSGSCSLVLSNPHEINLGSEGSYPMEEGISNIDSHPGLFAIGNNITSSGILSSGINQSEYQPRIFSATINVVTREHT